MHPGERVRTVAPTVGADGTESSATLSVDGAIAEIALASGPLNLVNKRLLRDLNSALRTVGAAAEVRCVIVHGGAARAFCAGSDIHEFASLRDDGMTRGFRHVESGPLVRSSYHAERHVSLE